MDKQRRKSENPAARRSKAALMYAFTELLTKKDISEITISEITEKAGLSRQAFYTNFSKKEDILDDMVRRLFEIYEEHLKSVEERPIAVLEDYFAFWGEHKTSLTVLFCSNLGYLFLERNTRLFQEQLNGLSAAMAQGEREIPYIKSFLSGITFNLLRTWVLNDGDLSSAELLKLVERIMKGMLIYE